MISDNDLYRLAIFFGTSAMILIVLYHFLEVNAAKDPIEAVSRLLRLVIFYEKGISSLQQRLLGVKENSLDDRFRLFGKQSVGSIQLD
ncbi:oligosaccaryltransferase [Fusarium subglutinans]|uniref:Dolichyl-diphosphooligosaccharide--protein glycosyltransferase subunit 4 n=1 Tax=Gibberella subglutinans TaxID=42677 RepID=A0A8H5QCT8_GIBSU|nr:oligosaccaryltransferase [Fusarium subglutinans]KAF5613451.1 oligosaccaryltransferase [Fusarium subglutinans]